VATIEPAYVDSVPEAAYPPDFFHPMHSDVPTHIIGRPVRVSTVTVTSVSTAAVHVPFVSGWSLNNMIVKALSPYILMRPTFEVQFLMRCSSTIYGAVMLGFYYGPETKPWPYTVLAEAQQLSSAHAHILPVSASGALTMNVPFVFPYDWISTTDPKRDELATVFVQSLGINTLEALADSDVDIEIWVTCTDIQTGGLVAQSTAATVGLVATGAQFASKAYNTMDSFQATSDSIRKLTEKVKIVNKTDAANNVADGFPAYGASVGVKDAQFGDINSLDRQVQLPRLTEMSIASKLNPSIYGDSVDHRLADIASNATYLSSTEFTTKGQIVSLDLDSSNFGLWHRYIMQHFRFYRGRPRFKFWFLTSPLLSFRFQVSFSPNSLFTVDASTSDVSKMNFLVKGSEEIVVEIPYIAYYPVMNRQTTLGKLVIECTQLATSLTATGNASCYVVATACMGDDTQYFSVCAPEQVRYVGQSLRSVAKEPVSLNFSTVPHKKTTLYDEVETVEQLMTRWSTRDKTPDSNGVLDNTLQKNPTYPTAFSKWGDKCDAFTCLFTLYRGSRDFRVLSETAADPGDIWVSMPQTSSWVSQIGEVANGTQYFKTSARTGFGTAKTFETYLEFTAPWLTLNVADTTYLTTFGDSQPFPIDTNYTVATKFWSRAGPDYQVFVLNMLPQGLLETTLTPVPP